MNTFALRVLVVLLLAFAGSFCRAELKIAAIFSDHVVLQRERPIAVWGSADTGTEVTVAFGDQQKRAVADAQGRWSVTLDPLKASAEARELAITAGAEKLTVKDALVGEVWHASGQSNMEWSAGQVAKALPAVKEQLAAAKYPAIRFRKISDGESAAPLTELRGKSSWTVCSPETAPGFSAVAFFFARRLHEELKIPIAIIDTSRGGTPIEPFIPRDAFASHDTLKRELELGDKQDLAGLRALPGGVFARDLNWLPGRLFNSRVAPIAAFAARGLIWYQGESNCGTGEDPRDYEHKMRALAQGWRGALGHKELPVYFVQLPGSGAGAHWPYLREEQRLASTRERTGMVVTIDLEGGDIHPPNKVDVGERLARWALAHDYGKKIAFSGPAFEEAVIKSGKVVVQFKHADSGLMIATKNGLDAAKETPDAALKHFELADESGAWHPAEAIITGKSVTVSSAKVPKPIAVRYAYRVTPTGCNLYNRDGLPASPFTSRQDLTAYDAKLPRD